MTSLELRKLTERFVIAQYQSDSARSHRANADRLQKYVNHGMDQYRCLPGTLRERGVIHIGYNRGAADRQFRPHVPPTAPPFPPPQNSP